MKISNIINEIVDKSLSYEDFVEDLKDGVKFDKPVKFLANDMTSYFITEMKIKKETLSQFNIIVQTTDVGEINFRIKHYRIKLFYNDLKTKYKKL